MNLELVGIENEVTEAIVLGDFCSDGDGALVGELAAEFEIVEGDGVVGRLRPDVCVSIAILQITA